MRRAWGWAVDILAHPAVVGLLGLVMLIDVLTLSRGPLERSTIGSLLPRTTRQGAHHGRSLHVRFYQCPTGLMTAAAWEDPPHGEDIVETSVDLFWTLPRASGFWSMATRIEGLMVFNCASLPPAQQAQIIPLARAEIESWIAEGSSSYESEQPVLQIIRDGTPVPLSTGDLSWVASHTLWSGYIHNAISALLGLALVVGASVGIPRFIRLRHQTRRFAAGLCPSCGYDLSGSADRATCPECGAVPAPP